MQSRMERILHSRSSSLLTARYLMATMAAQAGLLNMLLIMLGTLHLKQKVNILIKQLIKNALLHNSKMMFSLLISKKFKNLILNSQLKRFFWVLYQQELMPADLHSSSIVLVSSKSYVALPLTMLYSQSDMELRRMQTTGLLKILGLQIGGNKGTLEFKEI